mmetsp:Transcript_24177/g.38342  ORF Transcript_24177/g.38342 Transcript_24177/m.38342 type:complete len:191 (-) Transcript_24177:317-889(-)
MDTLWYNTDLNSARHSHQKQGAYGSPGWLSVCSKMQRSDERMHEITVNSKHIKIFCVLLMVASAILTFLGRGTFGLIQGVVGIIAGIEGYYGAMEYSLKNIKVLLIYLGVSSLVCIFMGVYSQYSTNSYCDVNSEAYRKQCESTVLTWTILYLSIGLVFNIIMIIAVLQFYWRIRKQNSTKQNGAGVLLD